jgi:hypothetical protein
MRMRMRILTYLSQILLMNFEKQVFTQIVDTYWSVAHKIAAECDCEGLLTPSAHIHTQTSLLIYIC